MARVVFRQNELMPPRPFHGFPLTPERGASPCPDPAHWSLGAVESRVSVPCPAFWGSPFGPGIRPVLRGGAPEQAGCAEGPQDEDVSLLF